MGKNRPFSFMSGFFINLIRETISFSFLFSSLYKKTIDLESSRGCII